MWWHWILCFVFNDYAVCRSLIPSCAIFEQRNHSFNFEGRDNKSWWLSLSTQTMETTLKAIDFHYLRMSDSQHLRVHQSARHSHQPNWGRLSITFIGLSDIWLTFQPENTKRGNVIWHPSILGRTRRSAGNSTAIVQIISPNNWEEAASCWRYSSPESKEYDQTKVLTILKQFVDIWNLQVWVYKSWLSVFY